MSVSSSGCPFQNDDFFFPFYGKNQLPFSKEVVLGNPKQQKLTSEQKKIKFKKIQIFTHKKKRGSPDDKNER